jgi:hypothetical protein
MAGKRNDWDYALRIRGVTPRLLPMGRLGEYIKAWAALLGEGNEPQFAGVVKGSAVLRAAVPLQSRLNTKIRLISARSGSDDGAARAASTISEMMQRDRVAGEVRDRAGALILEFRRANLAAASHPSAPLHDVAVVDGVVTSMVGADDTVHLRLQDVGGITYKVTVRNLETARQLARHFRGEAVRAHVHGTWVRSADGQWQPHLLYLDRFELLDAEPTASILARLSALPGNRWATMDEPDKLLDEIRGTG